MDNSQEFYSTKEQKQTINFFVIPNSSPTYPRCYFLELTPFPPLAMAVKSCQGKQALECVRQHHVSFVYVDYGYTRELHDSFRLCSSV